MSVLVMDIPFHPRRTSTTLNHRLVTELEGFMAIRPGTRRGLIDAVDENAVSPLDALIAKEELALLRQRQRAQGSPNAAPAKPRAKTTTRAT